MTHTKETISKFLDSVDSFHEHRATIDRETKKIDSYLDKMIKERVKHLPVRVYGPCSAHGHKMCVYINPNRQIVGYFHYLGGGNFAWSKVTNPKYYTQMDYKKPHPFDTLELLKICDELTEELGIKVEVVVTSLSGRCEDNPQDSEDIKSLHPNGVILAQNVIEYVGWECTDKWVIVEDDDGKHVYFGTSAHGNGMNVHLEPGDSLSTFFDNGAGDTIICGISWAREILNYDD
jgi:hypothetical protein